MTTLRKSRFIAEIKDGDRFIDVFFLETVQEKKKKKNGDPFWNLVLRDRTGSIDAKLWDRQAEPPRGTTYVKVEVEASTYQGDVQLTVRQIRPLRQDEEVVAVEDFVPVGPHDRYARIRELAEDLATMADPGLRSLCLSVVGDQELHTVLRDAPAAKGNHHNYVGGLLDHVSSLISLSRLCSRHYGLGYETADLLTAAAVFHDIGKGRELAWNMAIQYTTRGTLVGHVVDSLFILRERRDAYWSGWAGVEDKPPFDQLLDRFTHLEHVLASHHGRLEWGAAKLPMSREAQLFHLLDMVDSRMGLFDNIDSEKIDERGFISYVSALGSSAWRERR